MNTTNKTYTASVEPAFVSNWLQKLPDNLRDRAMANHKKYISSIIDLELREQVHNLKVHSLSEAIGAAFAWATTSEGYEFWYNVVKDIGSVETNADPITTESGLLTNQSRSILKKILDAFYQEKLEWKSMKDESWKRFTTLPDVRHSLGNNIPIRILLAQPPVEKWQNIYKGGVGDVYNSHDECLKRILPKSTISDKDDWIGVLHTTIYPDSNEVKVEVIQ